MMLLLLVISIRAVTLNLLCLRLFNMVLYKVYEKLFHLVIILRLIIRIVVLFPLFILIFRMAVASNLLFDINVLAELILLVAEIVLLLMILYILIDTTRTLHPPLFGEVLIWGFMFFLLVLIDAWLNVLELLLQGTVVLRSVILDWLLI
jgi:hypothetical protein